MAQISATSIDGRVVTASAEGNGPTLLVVHPGGQNADTWSAVARALAGDHQVVRLHRRLYATGVPGEGGHSMATEVADASAIVGRLTGPILLVGHSSGAVVALETALANPGPFAGVVAYEPPLPTTSLVGGPALARARSALGSGDLVEAIRIHLVDIVGMPAPLVEQLLADPSARTSFAAHAAAQITDDEALDALGVGIARYRSLTMPVTLIEGTLSPRHLLTRSADLAAILPNVEVVTLHDQGHIAHMAAPELLADVIRNAARRVGL